MTFDDFMRFDAPMLKAAYRMFIGEEEDVSAQYDIWYSTLKRFDRASVETAIRSWIGSNKYRPTPADIVLMMPSLSPDKEFKPSFADVNGKRVKLIQCMRCMDTGVISFEGKDGCVYGVPCDCPAGHANYKWGWLTEDEQKEVKARHPEEYKSSVVGENWYKINEALRNGAYKVLMGGTA